jgi:hypothetical protein
MYHANESVNETEMSALTTGLNVQKDQIGMSVSGRPIQTGTRLHTEAMAILREQ